MGENALSVCMLDIDHFKQINDTYGHEFGDHVLKVFAAHITSLMDQDDYFARIGGEEFCLISRNHCKQDVTHRVTTMLDTLSTVSIKTPRQNIATLSFSAGVAQFGKDGDDLDKLLSVADKALYYAKANGRHCVIPFDAGLFEKRDATLIPAVSRQDPR